MVEILKRFSYYAIIVYLIKEIKVTCNIHPFMIVSASVSPYMAELLLRKSGQPWIEWRNGRFRHWAYRVDHWENCSAAVVLRNYGATIITRYRDGNLGRFQRFLNYSIKKLQLWNICLLANISSVWHAYSAEDLLGFIRLGETKVWHGFRIIYIQG